MTILQAKTKLPALLRPHAAKIDCFDKSDPGYFVGLAPGWVSMQETHQVMEDTIADCARQLRNCDPCECRECVELLVARARA